MGDHFVSCALSGLTLRSEAVLVAIAPAKYRGQNPSLGMCHQWVSNEGACGLYAPVLLPICGHMSDYSDFEEIHEDKHTRWLEQKFSMPIKDICAHLSGRGGKIPVLEELAACRGTRFAWDGRPASCWFDARVWDHFIDTSYSDSGESNASAWEHAFFPEAMLEHYGFVAGAKDETKPQYDVPYTHPDIPGLIVWSDENSFVNVEHNGKTYQNIFDWSDIVTKVLRKPLPAKLEDQIRSTNINDISVLDSAAAYKKAQKAGRLLARATRDYPELQFHVIETSGKRQVLCDYRNHLVVEKLNKKEAAHAVCHAACDCKKHSFNQPDPWKWDVSVSEYLKEHRIGPKPLIDFSELAGSHISLFAPEFLPLYEETFFTEFLRETSELMAIDSAMFNCNRMFMPTFHGPQYGNAFMQRELARVTEKFADERCKGYEDGE